MLKLILPVLMLVPRIATGGEPAKPFSPAPGGSTGPAGATAGPTLMVETIAGGSRPVTLEGVSTGIGTPAAVAVDREGNIYMALTERRTVWRLDGPGSTVTRVAGAGRNSDAGDNGPAVSAQLSRPAGLAIDAEGNIYVADPGNARVRKVSSGIITTVAGDGTQTFGGDNGPAASAQLNCPSGVAVDASGDLYIADWGNRRVRKVSKGIITTVAGTGVDGDSGDGGPAVDAQLRNPSGVAVDSSGNLYIADINAARVRMVSRGVITTVAGNGTYGAQGDGSLAVNAQLSNPAGIAIDAEGSLYIADAANARIRKVSKGVITTVAGNGTTGYTGDTGPAAEAQLNWPRSVAAGPAGELYIVDTKNGCIRKVTKGRAQ